MTLLPDRRWYQVAAGLALVAPLAIWWPPAAPLLLTLDVLWVLLLAVDLWQLAGPGAEALTVTREAPPAFSVGRALPVLYRWSQPLSRAVTVRVREEFPAQLTPATAERLLLLPAGGEPLLDQVTLTPVHRGRGSGGRLHLRLRGPLGLGWRQLRRELPWQVVVYPNLVGACLRALPTQAQRRREAGVRTIRRIGEGRMFESLKEWVPVKTPAPLTGRPPPVAARSWRGSTRTSGGSRS